LDAYATLSRVFPLKLLSGLCHGSLRSRLPGRAKGRRGRDRRRGNGPKGWDRPWGGLPGQAGWEGCPPGRRNAARGVGPGGGRARRLFRGQRHGQRQGQREGQRHGQSQGQRPWRQGQGQRQGRGQHRAPSQRRARGWRRGGPWVPGQAPPGQGFGGKPGLRPPGPFPAGGGGGAGPKAAWGAKASGLGGPQERRDQGPALQAHGGRGAPPLRDGL
jgi:hypothetical protein